MRQIARNLLLIESVDDVRQRIERWNSRDPGADAFAPEIEAEMPVDRVLYPETLSLENFGHRTSRYFAILANRMRYAWHPDAMTYVYAYAYAPPPPLQRRLRKKFTKAMLARSEGRNGGWIDGLGLVKIGTSIDPERRKMGHVMPFNWLKRTGKLMILPLARANAGEHLEGEILNHIHPDDRFEGEWVHDTFGTFRALRTWFLAAMACMKGAAAGKKKGPPHHRGEACQGNASEER